jgi:hypothetical protein
MINVMYVRDMKSRRLSIPMFPVTSGVGSMGVTMDIGILCLRHLNATIKHSCMNLQKGETRFLDFFIPILL